MGSQSMLAPFSKLSFFPLPSELKAGEEVYDFMRAALNQTAMELYVIAIILEEKRRVDGSRSDFCEGFDFGT